MEKQNIKGYLQYFPNKDIIKRTQKHSRPKLLPHIIEEYQYRITNHLLIKKIISPKRDKIIVNSLQNIRKINHSPKRNIKIHAKGSLIDTIRRSEEYRHNSEHRAKTADLKRHQQELSLSSADFNESNRSKIKVIENSFEKSSPQQRQQKKQIRTNGFYRSLHERKTRHRSIIPQIYGFGPTILLIYHLQLTTNPLIKPDTLTHMQLIEKYALPNSSLIHNQDAQKVIRTQPITFFNLPKQERLNCQVKFALKVSKIGDFVPLRLWKYSGVQCIQLGTVDIPLSIYRLGLNNQINQSESDQLQWQQKEGSGDYRRLVLNGQVTCQLRGNNCQQIHTKVYIKYKVYSKRFTKTSQQIVSQL